MKISTVTITELAVAVLTILSSHALDLRAQPFMPVDVGAIVSGFQDDFNGSRLDSNWAVVGNDVYSLGNGLLHVASARGDPNHLLYVLPGYHNQNQEVLARIRVLNFGAGGQGYSRCGVGVAVDPGTSQGINYTFRDLDAEGQSGRHMAFLDDFRAWGPGQSFIWQTNVWYWMRLRHEPNTAAQGEIHDVFAKIWPADSNMAEPSDWQLRWDYTPTRTTRTGFAGILAGSTSGADGLAEFDVDYILIKAAGLPNIAVSPNAAAQIPVAITNQPQDQTVMELFPATFTIGARGNPQPSYQWFKNGDSLPGETNAALRLSISLLRDHGARFSATAANVVSNVSFSVTSRVATLFVVPDTNPPVLLRAESIGLNLVQVCFSERIAWASATNLDHYALAGSHGTVAIFSATLEAGQSNVLLRVPPLTENAAYTLLVKGLSDQAAAGNIITPDSQVTFTALEFLRVDIGQPQPPAAVRATTGGYTIAAGGLDIGGTADQFHFSYQRRSGDFDVCVRLESLHRSDAWAKAGLMARETLQTGSRLACVLATPSIGGAFFLARANSGRRAEPAGSFPVNYPHTWLRLQRAEDQFTGYASMDGEHWAQLGTVSLALPNDVFFGMAVASHHSSKTTIAQFRDLAPVAQGAIGPILQPFERLAACSERTGLVISEIMYHPAPRADGKELEFIELSNPQAFDEELSSYRLSGDIDFTFPAGTILPAGAFVVIAKSPADLQSAYGIAGVLGPFLNRLPNRSGTVRLRNEQDALLLEVDYDSREPWPLAADGAGHSLVLTRPSYSERNPRAWGASNAIGGSPGRADGWEIKSLSGVIVNEFLANSDPPGLDFIELYNASNQAVDLSGAWLSDDASIRKYRIPNGTMLAPRGFIYFDEARLGFALSSDGDEIFLVNSNGTRVIDPLRFGGQASNVSRGRLPDGAPFWSELETPSPGAGNGAGLRRQITINEIMYHPISRSLDDEYVELHNWGTNTIDLGGWRLSGAIDFTFPSGAAVAPGGYAVAARNLANLLAKYPNLTPANTWGNYSGALKDSGDRLVLEMPSVTLKTNGPAVVTTHIAYIIVNEVSYLDGGRWGRWSDGGGSSLELVDPRSDNRFAGHWADSDEGGQTTAYWTTIEHTGVLDLGMPNWPAANLQILLLGEGECLIDNVEVISGGKNLVANGTFEAGAKGWLFEGNHETTRLETAAGFNSSCSLHLRATGAGDSYANRIRTSLTATIAPGATATLRAQARWLCGQPEVLLRLRGNWLEAYGRLVVPPNLGTPGARNRRALANAGPAISDVTHRPVLPAANQAVVVSARMQDTDGVGSVQLKYRLDPLPAFAAIPMLDNGADGDVLAGDGLFSATIPAQAANRVVAFYIEASDTCSLPAVTRFPNDAPARECLVRFGEMQPFGSFGTYRLWLTQAALQRWTNRRKTSNQPLDCTLVYGAERVIYNAGVYYSGSPWKAAFNILDSPIGNMCDYHLRLPPDDRLLGATRAELAFPGNVDANNAGIDHTAQAEPISFWIARQLGLPYLERRYVHLFLNGVRRGSILHHTQEPNRDLVRQLFPNDAEGELFEGAFWFEADDVDQAGSSYSDSFARMANYTTTGGTKKTARYRWNFQPRAERRSANDFTNWFRLVDVLNGPAANYTEAVEAVVDAEQWMRVFAYEHLVKNWESFGCTHGVNMFFYKGQNRRWTLLPNDVDISFRDYSSDLFGTDDPVLQRMNSHPPFRRAYWRALQDAANGPMVSARVNPLLDARHAALLANGIDAAPPDNDRAYRIKTFIANMRDNILRQLATVAAPFAVHGPSTFTTDRQRITLSGTAPVAMASLSVNGVPWPVTWTSVNNWTIRVALDSGANLLVLEGWNRQGQPVAGAATSLNITYPGPGEPPRDNLLINEWLAANTSASRIADPADGDYEDWFELYNPGTSPVDLAGYYLTDNLTNRFQYRIPSGYTILPGHFLLVWADGEPDQNSELYPDLHVNFKLNKDGEAAGLFAPDGGRVDAVAFGQQTDNVSMGRYPNGGPTIDCLTLPTPRDRNSPARPLLAKISLSGSEVNITFSTIPGLFYRVDYKNTLDAPDWTQLRPAQVATGSVKTEADTVSGRPLRFYRVVRGP